MSSCGNRGSPLFDTASHRQLCAGKPLLVESWTDSWACSSFLDLTGAAIIPPVHLETLVLKLQRQYSKTANTSRALPPYTYLSVYAPLPRALWCFLNPAQRALSHLVNAIELSLMHLCPSHLIRGAWGPHPLCQHHVLLQSLWGAWGLTPNL